ncbi:SHOCT domain-containing protein [Pseudodesulfovibrio sp.]|nr:SHOCT domain-containing protein [Pseudodesulfovibrio sp.]
MNLFDIPLFMTEFFDFLDSPIWRAWPFNAGYGEHILPAIARLAFVSLIFGVIILFLRILFGPKGFFRDEEMDREADELRQQEIAELDEQLKKGEVTEFEYEIRLKSIQD